MKYLIFAFDFKGVSGARNLKATAEDFQTAKEIGDELKEEHCYDIVEILDLEYKMQLYSNRGNGKWEEVGNLKISQHRV